MANERKTERIFREKLENAGYYKDAKISVEEQSSDNAKIKKLLKAASKKGLGSGYPGFIITHEDFPNLLIVVECKADVAKHKSQDLDKFDEYACDGAILYASFLNRSYDVIAIGVSGESEKDFKVNHFLKLENAVTHSDFLGGTILPFEDYQESYITSPQKFQEDYSKLLAYSAILNKKLHSLKVKESQRSLLISGILISLKNEAFRAGYDKHQKAKQVTESLLKTIVDELTNAGVPPNRIANLSNAYSFIKTHSVLSEDKKKLIELIQEVDEEINGFMETHQYFDTIGQFYIEFLRYANNDKGLGIVLTPPHITELFVDIAGVTKDTIVWDNCCGTGGFLISAMKKMVIDCNGDQGLIRKLKKEQIFGLEYQDDIYALAVSNMILHGDGKSNIILGDCFKPASTPFTKGTVGLLNPPYKSDSDDIEELEYIFNNLDNIEKNGTCIAIIPISCLLGDSGVYKELKERLMKKHTLEAVMSMPEDLFHNSKVGVITSCIVITAHVPHPKGKKTWLGYWRSDGFLKVKGKGRIDRNNVWPNIKQDWLLKFKNREVDQKTCVMIELKPEDEWCAEAYLSTDYSLITENDFEKTLRQYMAFKLVNEAT